MKSSYTAYLLLAFLMIILLTGCSENKRIYKKADSYYKQGDYHKASLLAIQSLSLKPSYAKAQLVLKDAYPRALQEHRERIAALELEEKDENWPLILEEYLALQSLNEAIRKLPQVMDADTGERIKFDYLDYSADIAEAKTESADYYYRQGMHYSMMSGDSSTQKKAAGYFKNAMQYITDYKDSALRYEECRQKAIHRIAILPFEDKSGSRNRYGAITDILADHIISGLLQDKTKMEFVEIITRDQIDQVLMEQQLSSSGLVDEASAARIGQLLGAHEILSGRILQIDYSAPKVQSVDLEQSSNITVEREDGEEETEMEVVCYYRKFTKRSSVRIVSSYSVVDVASGKINTQQSFTAAHSFEDEWASVLGGDNRALNPAQKALTTKAEPFPPSEKDMILEALMMLSEKILNHFGQYLQ